MQDFDEREHPRNHKGQFIEKRQGYYESVNARVQWAMKNEIDLPLTIEGTLDDLKLQELYVDRLNLNGDKIKLSKQEYAILRKEVMRKNSEQKGKVKPTNCGYTSNYFYVYTTSGGDSFTPIRQFNIEKDRDKINYWLERLGG